MLTSPFHSHSSGWNQDWVSNVWNVCSQPALCMHQISTGFWLMLCKSCFCRFEFAFSTHGWLTPLSFAQVSSSLFTHSAPPAPCPLLVLLFQSLHGPRLYHPHTGTHSSLTHSQRHSQGVPRVDRDWFAELSKKAGVAQDFVSPPCGVWVPTSAGVGSCTVSWTR